MEHLSEVVKILDAALMHDTRKAHSYGELLAAKLEGDCELRQARAVRAVLAKMPGPAIGASSSVAKAPVDVENMLAIVDVTPAEQLPVDELVLHPYVRDRLGDFLESVQMYDTWAAKGVAASNRLLIYGPPGTGKTSIAARIAKDLRLPLVLSRSDALMSSLLGQTSRNLRTVFDFNASMPCVLFLDEFDALAKNRGDSHEIGELQRVVISLLQNIDAMDPSTILVAATNHPQLLDSAVWRRFDYTLKVDLPGAAERTLIWRNTLAQLASADTDLSRLVDLSEGLSGSAITSAANDMWRVAVKQGVDMLPLPTMLRRLARVLWFDSYEKFKDGASEIAALREWAPDVFTVRALSESFGVSTRQVSKAIGKVTADA
ncbi:ATPase family protein associated with various cellular activities (AAA) [Mycobacterium sp. BK086]|uniref:AAA family ATPase n=1 Tax=Mycobacterium sp. BK086 TaxID=2512165 RepID=UPI00105F6202|nr:AAA family ATPase [Mycobacterium sp. BK086]TDO06605.1 ATPase family protein associated with various cellular activities (AAA) [Mycobacterium sp. BK086]